MSIYILGLPDCRRGRLGWTEDMLEKRTRDMAALEKRLTDLGFLVCNPAHLPLNLLGTGGLATRAAMIQASGACIQLYNEPLYGLSIDCKMAEYYGKRIFMPKDIEEPDGALWKHSEPFCEKLALEAENERKAVPNDRPKASGEDNTYAVELVIQRFYKVYVPDPDGRLSNENAIMEAKRLALESEDNLNESDGMEIEEDDIVSASVLYEF